MTRPFMYAILKSVSAFGLLYPVAVAAQDYDVRMLTVRTADLDLASPLGKRVFEQRITRAIGMVCDAYGEAGLTPRRNQTICRAEARRVAAPRIRAVIDAPPRQEATVLAAIRVSAAR